MSVTEATGLDIADYNARWLAAWTDKDVDRLTAFYADGCIYKDPQTSQGLSGRPALRAYLEGLFAATPAMTYTPDEVWPIAGGFCGRWYCQVEGGARLRGFDLVLLDGERIVLNEVYVHTLP
ncbi:nuclear transport factor 2 family protein [Phenylobacterium sp.]|uniref:YybH family protein n=1 Tax=Phenylobacterium sp. TaxID=1871053 RepID=UPI002C1C0192|nr:nuclear transport factor 2 family protein [Phenylobacterium sp.]HVI30953.1 nuclear transport factor 2 family protein [Phenylobacterium sp.]